MPAKRCSSDAETGPRWGGPIAVIQPGCLCGRFRLSRVSRGRRPERRQRPSPGIRRSAPRMTASPSRPGARQSVTAVRHRTTGWVQGELAPPTQTGHRTAEIDSREAVNGWCSRGRSTMAASHCMNSSGDITSCVVPSRQGVFNFSTTWPTALVCTRSLASAGRVM